MTPDTAREIYTCTGCGEVFFDTGLPKGLQGQGLRGLGRETNEALADLMLQSIVARESHFSVFPKCREAGNEGRVE